MPAKNPKSKRSLENDSDDEPLLQQPEKMFKGDLIHGARPCGAEEDFSQESAGSIDVPNTQPSSISQVTSPEPDPFVEEPTAIVHEACVVVTHPAEEKQVVAVVSSSEKEAGVN